MCFLFLATLTIPEELPQYKKNAYTIFHELLTWIDELTIELNIRQMQMASLFTSMQQVEIRRHKEGETIEEYNRHKSLANLTKARFMKQMEKINIIIIIVYFRFVYNFLFSVIYIFLFLYRKKACP